MPVTADGIVFNTAADVGTPFLDKLNTQIDAAVANRNQLRGLAAGGVIAPSAAPGPSLFGQAFGVNTDGSPVQDPAAAPPPTALAAPAQANQPVSTGPGLLPIFQNAISSVESGGNYAAKGPVTGSGDRAFGKYQVMASNVGPWTKEILGQELTPQQFLANPQAQDAVFNGKFGQYLQKTGNPQDAASMWFTGRPQAQGGNASDQLGTTGNAYVAKFMAALPGSRSAQAPAPQPALAYAPGNGAAPPPIAPAASAISNAVAPPGGAAPADGLPVPPSKPVSAGGVVPDAADPADANGVVGMRAAAGMTPQASADNLAPSSDAPEGSNTPPPFMATGRSAATGDQPAPQQVAAQSQPQAQPQQAPQGIGQQNGGGPLYSSIGTPPSMDQIKALVANPATRQMGLQLWQAAVQPRAPIKVGAGETVLSPATGAPIYSSPVKLSADEALVSGTGGGPIATNPGKDMSVQQIGEDQFGNKAFGSVDKRTGVVTPIGGQGGAGSSNPMVAAINSGLTGDALLATLPAPIAAQIKAIQQGRTLLPQGQALRTPMGQALSQLVQQFDPTFEQGNATARNKVRIDYESGPTANVITAGNTALQHLGDVSDAAEELGNSQIPVWNKISNTVQQAAGGQTALNKYRTSLGNFAGEVVKFYRGTGGSEADIQGVYKNLDPNQSPDQLRAGVFEEAKNINSKVSQLQDRWRQGMGPNVAPFPIITPKTQGVINGIVQRYQPPNVGPVSAPAPAASNAAPQAAPAARQAPDGHFYVPDAARPGKYLRLDP